MLVQACDPRHLRGRIITLSVEASPDYIVNSRPAWSQKQTTEDISKFTRGDVGSFCYLSPALCILQLSRKEINMLEVCYLEPRRRRIDSNSLRN